MINYWDFSGNYFDKVGSSDLYGAFNAFFVSGRNGKNNSAVRLIYGYIILPTGYYFTNTFSVTAWVYVNSSSGANTPFIQLSNMTNVYFNFFQWDNQIKLGNWYTEKGLCKTCVKATPFSINSTWVHVAFTYDGSYNKMYSNGTLSLTTSTNSLSYTSIKTSNYIGKWINSGNTYGDFILDELKFFNRALSQTEIINDMNLNN